MTGKGSKPRPLSVSQSEFDKQWDLIFRNKNMKKYEHKRNVQIAEEISRHWSRDVKKESVLLKSENGYFVDLYEQSKFVRTIDCSGHSLQWAEDCAENYVLYQEEYIP